MDDSFYLPLTLVSKPENWAGIVGTYKGPYKFPDSMMMYSERPGRAVRTNGSGRKRSRATVIAEQDGRVLLIRERGARSYSLPGG